MNAISIPRSASRASFDQVMDPLCINTLRTLCIGFTPDRIVEAAREQWRAAQDESPKL
jgi:hypothetical protein